MNTIPISLDVDSNEFSLDVSVDGVSIEQTLGMDTSIQVMTGDHYQGETSVTPSQETQVLETQGLFMDSNITVAPIPSNYGLITWNGAYLTVS